MGLKENDWFLFVCVDNHLQNGFEVEFSDSNGRTYATLALKTSQLMQLHYEPLDQAS